MTIQKIVISAAISFFSFFAFAQAPSTGAAGFDIICGAQYECFSDEKISEMLTGKTVKYKHPRGSEFGIVTLTLNKGGSVQAYNAKGSAGYGTWSIKSGKIFFDTKGWGEFSFQVVRLGGVMLLAVNTNNGLTSLVPYSVE